MQEEIKTNKFICDSCKKTTKSEEMPNGWKVITAFVTVREEVFRGKQSFSLMQEKDKRYFDVCSKKCAKDILDEDYKEFLKEELKSFGEKETEYGVPGIKGFDNTPTRV